MVETDFDSFLSSSLSVQVCEPTKIGEGFTAYVQYKVITRVTDKNSSQTTGSVFRRFKEFFNLFQYLTKLYVPQGYVVVKPPERSLAAMTKLKMLEESVSDKHVFERMYRLETFINTILSHKVIGKDEGVYSFLHKDSWESFLKVNPKKSAFDDLVDKFEDIFPVTLNLSAFDEWFVKAMNECFDLYNKLEILRDSLDLLQDDRSKQHLSLQAFSTACTNMCFSESNGNLAKLFNKYANLLESLSGYKRIQSQLDLKYLVANTKDMLAWLRGSSLVFKKAILNSMELDWQQKALDKKLTALSREEMSASARKIGELKSQIVGNEAVIAAIKEAQEGLLSTFKNEMRNQLVIARMKKIKSSYLSYLKDCLEIEQKIIGLYEEFMPICQEFDSSR